MEHSAHRVQPVVVDNVPFIDVPDDNIKKMSVYRTFLSRFDCIDANIPGNDFQFPASVEGAREGWNSYKVHGGDPEILRNFAHYAECDVKGQLAKYDSDHNLLMEYTVGFLTGNDADAVSFRWAPAGRIMPFYTADQAEAGTGGSNHFSNINATLQAQVFAKAPAGTPLRVHHAPDVSQTPGVVDLGTVHQW
jgi:hypothetical protein